MHSPTIVSSMQKNHDYKSPLSNSPTRTLPSLLSLPPSFPPFSSFLLCLQLKLCEAGGLPQLVQYLMLVFRPGGCAHPTIKHVAWIMCHLADALEGAMFIKKSCATRLLVRSIMSGPHNKDWPRGPAVLPAVAAIGRMAIHNEDIRSDLLGNLAINAVIAILKVVRKVMIFPAPGSRCLASGADR